MLSPNDEQYGRHITINEDLTYRSEHVWQEASEETVKAWGNAMAAISPDCVVRFENACFSAVKIDAEMKYYEDLLRTYEEHGFSWWSNDWQSLTTGFKPIAGAKQVDYPPLGKINVQLLRLLQKYQCSKRP